MRSVFYTLKGFNVFYTLKGFNDILFFLCSMLPFCFYTIVMEELMIFYSFCVLKYMILNFFLYKVKNAVD